MAKKAGCMVGTTTNCMMLDSDKISELIDEGIDIIGFSLAGIDERNDSIRKGTQISKVLKCIDEIHRIKNSKSVDNPRIHIAYMLLKSGLKDIHKLPAIIENAGVDQTVISSLSFVVNEDMEKETLLTSDDRDCRTLMSSLSEIQKEGESRGVDIAFNIVSPLMEESYCSENIERALVIGSDGSVSPCVMGLIPATGDNYYYFRENRMPLEKMVFGNIAEEELNTIWHKKECRDFLRAHKHRGGFETRLCDSCKNCHKRFIMDFR